MNGSLVDFKPNRIFIVDHNGQRWWTNSNVLVPYRHDPAGAFMSPGVHELHQGDYEVQPITEKTATAIQALIESEPIPVTTARDQLPIVASPADGLNLLVLLGLGNGVYLNRLLIEGAEQIAGAKVRHFGAGESGPITMYDAERQRVGLIMRVRVEEPHKLITIGREWKPR